MGADENKERVLRAVARFNTGDLDGYLASYAGDAVVHGLPPSFAPTRDGLRSFLEAMLQGVPDFRVEVNDVVAEGDRVATRLTYRGTHQGELLGVPATGRTLEWQAMTIRRLGADGRTVERWILGDTPALLAQLGYAPPAPPSA